MLDFLLKFPDLLHSAIVFGTVIMFGALGEIITEKSGNLNLGVPGIKLGIANLVVVVGLFFLPAGEVLMISVARILLMGYLFGNGMSILYSLAGGLLSFLVMLLLKHIKGFSITGVSIAGGVTHNVAQICVAALVVQNRKLFYYLPALLVAGVITGMLIGILSDRILSAVKRDGRKSSSR